jgi:hypothetical protein
MPEGCEGVKVIIAGSRDLSDPQLILAAVKASGFDITEVVCGMANGIDTAGARWAVKNGIPVKPFPAHWDKYGKSAGRIRNAEMAMYGEALIAITTGSPGTRNMISSARARGLPTHVLEVAK